MDRVEAMGIFVAVVETGSFSGASRKLDLSLATVSRKVADLEDHLKTRLLTRSTRKIAVTEAGQNFLVASRQILEQIEEAERAAAGEFSAPRGDLTLTAPVCFGRLHVGPVIHDFLATFPEINIKLILSDRNLHLIDDHVDLAIRIGALPDSAMMATRLGSVRHILCGSLAYFAGRGEPNTPGDLEGHACITFDALDSPKSWTFCNEGKLLEQPVRSRYVVDGAWAAIDAAAANLGVARVLSYQAEAAIQSGAVKEILADYAPDPLPVNFVYAGQGLIPIKTRCFIEYAAPRIRKSLAAAK
ncbi:LysR family transcriptional regulator [Rhodoblastus sp. 17X3]|uniref:LysR family transcriptional regulator n=1 Tax=Rhodoblastus sp. 17X3 TaxID=3047026 RepID=UPI0024B7E72F|nr:LysR family transcriptional regulator [Rhodoblastus sp. 17X3]MDI9848898.1 LysR family transcriptional regulator [Rhodoblastus sp. 17X3]